MGKKSKNKKVKRRKFISLKRVNPPSSNEENSESEKEKLKLNRKKKKLKKELKQKEKELKKKLKKLQKKKKKNKNKENEENLNLGYDYLDDLFMNQEDVERLPHDKFFTYPVPYTSEENKDYIPLLISESDIILELLDSRDIYHSRNTQIEELINGYDNNNFCPENYLTRAEFIKIISKILKRSNSWNGKVYFKDVPQNFWAYDYIMNAANGE